MKHDQKAHETFNYLDVKITTTGQRHLGAVIGSLQYKNEYVMKLVNSWTDQLHIFIKDCRNRSTSCLFCFHKWVSQ